MSKTIEWPGPSFIPGSSVTEIDSKRTGVMEEGGYIRFEDERVVPSAAARLWQSNKICVAPLRGPLARAHRARQRAAERAVKAPGVKVEASRPVGGPYAAWKQAEEGGLAPANNWLVELTGSRVGNGSPEHGSGCQTAWGSALAPDPGDLVRCNGCWSEHMWWVTRLDVLNGLFRAFETYLRDSVNELLAPQGASAGSLSLATLVREGQGADRDWQTLVEVHRLLGTRLGSETTAVRRLVAERQRFRELEPTAPEYQRLAVRLRDECLTPGGLERLVEGLSRAAERVRSRSQGLREPAARFTREQFITAAAERGLLDVRARPER